MLQAHRQPQRLLEVAAHGLVVAPGQVRREAHDLAVRVQKSRHGHSYRPDVVGCAQIVDHLHDRAGKSLRVVRRVGANRIDNHPVSVHHCCACVRAADVESDGHR